jgi:hypothetical protein
LQIEGDYFQAAEYGLDEKAAFGSPDTHEEIILTSLEEAARSTTRRQSTKSFAVG